MKIVFSFLAIILSTISFSQEYIPMLQEENEWNVDIYYDLYDPPNPPIPFTITYQITLGEEVIVNGNTYTQIYSDLNATCLLREEDGIVYKLSGDNTTEKVLFDFTLELGDEFNAFESAYEDYPFCLDVVGFPHENLNVESIEYLNISGETRKVITFSELGYNDIQFQWIEGIGNITGFSAMWGQVDITNGSLLVCFTNNGNTTFFNDATSCDNTTLSITENKKEQTILYPNPVSNTSILKLPESNHVDFVKIVDFNGRLVKEFTIQNNKITINAMDYASGLYFYQIYAEGNLIESKEFIVK